MKSVRVTREGSIRVGNRTITYLEAGAPGGPLVLHNHGGPSSRLEAALFDSYAKANGLRFVCADRPGIGGSDLQSGRTFESWADDLLLLADSLAHLRDSSLSKSLIFRGWWFLFQKNPLKAMGIFRFLL